MGGGAKLGVGGLALMGAGAAVDAFADEDSTISKVAHSDTLNYAATGAMIGGAAGSLVPVVGNAAGAAVGGAIGGAIGLYNDLTGGKEGGNVANQNIQVQNATIQANGNAATSFAQGGSGTFTNADGQQVSLGADQNGRLAISQNGVTATTDIPANALQAFAGNPQGAEMLAQMMSSYAGANPSRLAQMLNSGFAENGGLTAQMQQNLSALSELRNATGTTLNGFGGSEIPLITNNQRMMDFAGVHTGVPASMMDTFSGPHAQMFAQAAGQLTPQQLQAYDFVPLRTPEQLATATAVIAAAPEYAAQYEGAGGIARMMQQPEVRSVGRVTSVIDDGTIGFTSQQNMEGAAYEQASYLEQIRDLLENQGKKGW